MKHRIIRTIKAESQVEWCALEVELADGRLSICGSAGHVLSERQAKKDALQYWISFFEESPIEIFNMSQKCGTRFTSPRSAAKYVLTSDGQYHGLDVYDYAPHDGRVYTTHTCGQIRDELVRFFPEVKPFLRWHLNDMRAECKHQEARGETWTTHPSAVCPDCGYKLGSQWLRRRLPKKVIAWVKSLESLKAA